MMASKDIFKIIISTNKKGIKMNPSTDLNFSKCIALAALDKKAKDIKVLEMMGKSDICNFQVICSGESDRHVQAIANEIDRVARKNLGMKSVAIEGTKTSQWILIDFGSVMAHIFLEESRNYYAIEQIWPEASLHSFT